MHNRISPSFSGKLMNETWYRDISGMIRTLRPHTSLSQIALHLQRMGFRTATGLDWDKSRVNGFIRNSMTD